MVRRDANHVFDADIRDYFGSIDHDKLMKLVGKRISDRRVLKPVRQWLEAGVMEEGVVSRTTSGTPQGGVISPLLSNIYLHVLDVLWTRRSAPLGTLVRYADDFVVMCRTKKECEQAIAEGNCGNAVLDPPLMGLPVGMARTVFVVASSSKGVGGSTLPRMRHRGTRLTSLNAEPAVLVRGIAVHH